jgi:curved DNA-binding protein CbpA
MQTSLLSSTLVVVQHVTTDEAKHRAHIMFQRVNEANEVLSDAAKRQTYVYTQRQTYVPPSARPAPP